MMKNQAKQNEDEVPPTCLALGASVGPLSNGCICERRASTASLSGRVSSVVLLSGMSNHITVKNYNAEIFVYKLWRSKICFQFEIIINVLVISSRSI